jgi:hypothetical protein
VADSRRQRAADVDGGGSKGLRLTTSH